MDEVADGLFVGTVEDAGDEALIRDHGIAAVLSLTHSDPDGGFPPGLAVTDVPMMDGPRNDQRQFDRAVSHVLSHLGTGDTLLVHCSAGASRSPAVAATALALYDELDLDTAFEQVANRRSAVEPHDAIVRQAVRVHAQYRDTDRGD
ncbi:dual specificity protein phosphatase family protein [Haloplanus sp. C73]|uniref:dual specificity protein phosphatase family protein n=1 Tax=Haloplanus sp. C73 TaxID=3421641 RepID=UPI003EBF54CA